MEGGEEDGVMKEERRRTNGMRVSFADLFWPRKSKIYPSTDITPYPDVEAKLSDALENAWTLFGSGR